MAIEKTENEVFGGEFTLECLTQSLSAAFSALLPEVQSHTVLREPKLKSLTSFGWHLFPCSGKGPKDIDFSAHLSPPSV